MNLRGIFETVLNMSLTASLVIMAVLIFRLILRKAPKRFSYVLWLVVLIKLLIPFSIESKIGFFPQVSINDIMINGNGDTEESLKTNYISSYKLTEIGNESQELGEKSNNPIVNNPGAENNIKSSEAGSQALEDDNKNTETYSYKLNNNSNNSEINIVNVLSVLWVVIAVAAIMITLVKWIRLKLWLSKTVKSSMINNLHNEREKNIKNANILYSDKISQPFVVGIIKPLICIPEGLSDIEEEMIIAHEKAHIKYGDYFLKTIAYVTLCIHWFNPFVWLAFNLMEQDMEMACDEEAVKNVGYERKKLYAHTLLNFSERQLLEKGFITEFSGKSTKKRIKNAIAHKKQSGLTVFTATVIAGCGIVGLLFSDNTVNAAIFDNTNVNNVIAYNMENNIDNNIDNNIKNNIENSILPYSDDSADTIIVESEDENEDVSSNIDKNGIIEIPATYAGKVYAIGYSAESGKYVFLEHGKGLMSYYPHCEEILVEKDSYVEKGQIIVTVRQDGKNMDIYLNNLFLVND